MNIASKLSNSTFLQDLSTVSGTDLVGKNASASALGLGSSYTVALLSYCSEGGPDGTECSKPKFGFHFDPLKDLKLDNTGLSGSFPSKLLNAIKTYGTSTEFLAAAYLLAFIFTFFTPVFSIIATCAPRIIIGGAISSIFATFFLFAASVAGIVIFTNVKGSFNSDLVAAGIKTALGNKLFILSWVATVFSLISTVLLWIHARRAIKNHRRGMGKNMIIPNSTDKAGAPDSLPSGNNGPRKLTLLQRSLTWNKHKYAQISKGRDNPKVVLVGVHDDDGEELLSRGFGGGEDEHDVEEDELVRGSTRGIPLSGMGGNKASRDMNTAYEPFKHSLGS